MHTFTNQSIQTEGSTFASPTSEQGVSDSGASLWSKHSPPPPPQVFTHLATHIAGYLHRQGILILPYLEV